MKKDKKAVGTKQTRTPQIGRLTLLVGALVATGVLSPLSLPTAAAASLLPLPCGGCVNNSGAAVHFVQQGTLFNIDPITGQHVNVDPFTGLPLVSSNSAGGETMTINQNTSTAILNWQEFNVGPKNKVVFNQYNIDEKTLNDNGITLNRVWNANPSIIAGSISSNGQVYLINQNGIVFANGAQVNVNTLIASSLDITDQLFTDGYTKNTRVIPAFGDGINGVHGFVRVDTGAELNGSRIMLFAPVVENKGMIHTTDGQTILAAGTKVYLEASQDTNLRGMLVEVDVDNAGVADTVMADNAAKAGIVLQHTEAGVVTNAGQMSSERGNTTLVGFAVNQQGRISATTSVTENGSIKLLARYDVAPESPDTINTSLAKDYGVPLVHDIRARQTGKVTLATGSETVIAPQQIEVAPSKWEPDPATITSDQTFKKSIVEVMGNTINMQSGSKIIVPGGQVTLAAISSYVPYVAPVAPVAEVPATTTTPAVPAVLAVPEVKASGLITAATDNSPYQNVLKDSDKVVKYSSFLNPNYKPASATNDKARVFLDSGSLIDVSGSTANVSVARNIVTVQLRGSPLADSPVQRTDRFLWGKDVQVDIRQGTPLAAYASEETSQIVRTAAELTSAGGTVKLVSTGDVVMKSGAKVDLSGGWVNYTGANIKTTTLISDGVVYNIANASPDRIYRGISGTYTDKHNKWGTSETYTTLAGGDIRGRWDPGYVEGKSAGSLTVLAPHAVVDGDIVARIVAGIYQRKAYVAPAAGTPYKDTWEMMPQGGELVVGDSEPLITTTGGPSFKEYVNNSDVTIASEATRLASNFSLLDSLPANLITGMVLDADLFGSATGMNRIAVYSNNAVTIKAGTSLKLAPGGSIKLQGNEVNMLGSIDAPSGTVDLSTTVTSQSKNQIAGALTVGAANTGSYISTRGQWINDSRLFGVPDWSKPLLINGGSITLNSGGDLFAAGALLDASGGAWLDNSNKYNGGSGGDITLKSGKSIVAFKTVLDGVDLRSYGTAGEKGGSLTIAASDIILGESANANNTNAGTTLALSAAFFQKGGFSNYDLTAQFGDLTVTKDTVIEPKAQSLILDQTAFRQASGSDVSAFSTVGLLPYWQRKATSITLNSSNDLQVEEGAVIRVEPTANIKLTATNQLTVLGTLDAAAGSITLDLTASNNYYSSAQVGSIWLGSQSKLLSQGYFLQSQPNPQNLVQGQVLTGGKININTSGRFVVAQQGSVMDVSGTSADLDLPQLVSGSLVYRRSHVAGDAGSISIKTNQGGFLDGEMKAGVEVGSQAAAGSFTLTLEQNPGFKDSTLLDYIPLTQPQLRVTNSGNGGFAAQAGLTPGSDTGAGVTSLGGVANKFLLDASALQKSGFDQVTLKSHGSILLDQTNLQTKRSLTLDAPEMVVNGSSTLESAHVTLGQIYDPEGNNNQALLDPLDPAGLKHLSPSTGSGQLNVSATQLVDLTGNVLVSGVKELNVTSSGDIRMNGAGTALTGSLHTQGDVTLTADQVYPTTLAQFTLSVEDGTGNAAGKITVLPGQHGPSPVMSAGGMLKLSAAKIAQYGVVKAPLGTIDLSATQKLTLGDPLDVNKKSLTSVSAEGLTIPFGTIQGGNAWEYDTTGAGSNILTLSAPPKKQVKMTAPDTEVNGNATVDLSGGGDLYASEFFAGSGGSENVLDPLKAPANTFAIIPGVSGYSPYDPQSAGQYAQTGSKTSLQSGASVYLAGGNGIKAGYYTLLPASYALLPGAYRITAVSGYPDRQPGLGATTLVDGSQIMAGKFAVVGTNIQDARYSGFRVTPGAVVRTQSEYHDSFANKFFADLASANETLVPRLAIDGGQLIVSANTSLAFEGTIKAVPAAGGRGAFVDLDGPGFDIVNTVSTTPVYSADGKVQLVQLTTSSLNKLGANSLLIGGVRTQSTTGMDIAVSASEVIVDNKGSVLSGPEIILAAKDKVAVKAGSDIEGSGTYSGQATNLAVNGDGALLRVSSAAQVGITRTNPTGAVATLSIEDLATVGAQNAVLLDSSNVTTVGNKAVINAKFFSVAAQNIDIGNPSATNSLALSGDLLTRVLAFKDITLHSYNDINFFGTGSLGGLDANQLHILDNLVLDSRNLNGINNSNQTNNIDAANVTLLNSNSGTATAATAVGYGAGNLKINADQITLGAGDKAIQGFDKVTFTAAKQILAQGKSNVTLDAKDAKPHQLVLEAGQITGASKSDLTITAGNDDIIINPVKDASTTAGESLNAKLKIVGNSIKDDGVINLSSGTVTLHANDYVTLGATSITTATGISKLIAGHTAYAQAGTVALLADTGNVDIQSGAVVDVSAAAGGDAGSINIAATNGAVSVAGELRGRANTNYAQGSFTLDAKSLTGTTTNALTELNDILTDGDFTTLRDMRIRTGDLEIAADVAGAKVRATAQTFRLTADGGSIDVYGKVDASGTSGGTILLAAKNDLTLRAGVVGALLDAHASGTGESGGKVTLETSETRVNGIQMAAGKIELGNQYIDVHGDGNTGGSVLLRAPRNVANTDVNVVNSANGTPMNVSTGANVTVEAFKTYESTNGTLTNDTVRSNYYDEAKGFASYANVVAIKNRLGMTGQANQHLSPGVEIGGVASATNLNGDLTLSQDWDLSTWRFNDGTGTAGALTEAGILTLRAVGNLQFGTSAGVTASLTDGVANNTNTYAINSTGGPVNKAYINPMAGPSWSYRLVSGADLSSANVMAVNNRQTGDFRLVAGKEVLTLLGKVVTNPTNQTITTYTMEQIRTGTGFIDIAAGGSFNLDSKYSVIYTMGQPTANVTVKNANTNNRYFGVDGGDISILAKGDINGAATDQLVTDWQWREGLPNADGSIATQPAWWINLQSFRQNIGALGGGNVSITAGKNINNLSAVVPTTGYVDMSKFAHPTVVLGGGDLSVTAGGDINSGVYYVGNGQGTVKAGGNLGTSRKYLSTNSTTGITTTTYLQTILALGQGNFDVRAGGDLNLETILNPTMKYQGTSQLPTVGTMNTALRTYFFTYDNKSGVSLASTSGDVTLQNSGDDIFYEAGKRTNIGGTTVNGMYEEAGSGFFKVPRKDASTTNPIYPGTLEISALGGSISGKRAATLFPSSTGNLQLIAASNIQFGTAADKLGLTMSDAASSSFQANKVVTVQTTTLPTYASLISSLNGGRNSVHAQDTQPVIISAGGNISGYMELPKSAQIEAGQDVQNLGLIVQNLNDADTTSVIAGRDITYDYDTKASVTPGITVYGPGQLVLQAGRNVDLGRSDGVVTKGNLNNYLLPELGASVAVLAGVGQGATATKAFVDKYINPSSAGTSYDDELIAYVGNYTNATDQTAEQAFTTFSDWSKDAVTKPLQDAFVRQVLFSELKQSGRNAVTAGNYQAGYDAIATLFPSTGYKGDINLYSSQIKTERGGSIDLLTPGGGVNAGLANVSSKGATKEDSELGIVTIKGGDVNAFVNNDFLVNQSRVFTLQGGNILMWSSYGNIDAGKGSKSASSTPAPQLIVDPKTGTFKVDVTGSVVGSGIRVLLANKDVVPGSVDLYAPSGEINAGDAGIGAAGNIFLGALVVRGADNINFGGTSAGVPVAAPAPVSVGLGNLTDASKAADQATQSIGNMNMNTNDFKPTFLSIEVIGLGDGAGL